MAHIAQARIATIAIAATFRHLVGGRRHGMACVLHLCQFLYTRRFTRSSHPMAGRGDRSEPLSGVGKHQQQD